MSKYKDRYGLPLKVKIKRIKDIPKNQLNDTLDMINKQINDKINNEDNEDEIKKLERRKKAIKKLYKKVDPI